jgi:hypothetical protein
LCTFLAANCWWASAFLIPSDTKNILLNVACSLCKPLVQQSSLCRPHMAQTGDCNTLAACHWFWAVVWPGFRNVANHATKIFQYWQIFF